MKQTLFMVALTLAGTLGAWTVRPFWGVAVYHLFGTLRPQYMWEWALPAAVRWSQYVALATIAATLNQWGTRGQGPRVWSRAHTTLMAFGSWIFLTYITSYDIEYSYKLVDEYYKIITMFVVSALVIRRVADLWALYLIAAGAIAYISYEVNYLYLVDGYLKIFHAGYSGLDNNGAGLMLAMGVPLCLFAWEGMRSRLRWVYLALVPAIIHAVMTSYSRGAMLSLVVTTPLVILRSRYRVRMGLGIALFAVTAVPVLAGAEIRARFLTISDHEQDESAQSRRQSWAAAWAMAKDHPILGVGPRNANLFSYQYGADVEGRTIHSQYLQIAADCGFVGLALYLSVLAAAAVGLRRARRLAAACDEVTARRVRAIAGGVECAMALFCVGAIFLSLEVFELPYLMILLAMQLPLVAGVPAAPRPIAGPEGR